MPAAIATLVFAIGVGGLFKLDRDPKAQTSKALWIPVVWLWIGASRMVSEWLGAFGLADVGTPMTSAGQMLDGSPLDRFLISGLVVLSLIILVRRGRKVETLLRSNGPIVLFFLYCAVSVFWSDYPLVAFKRWIKDLGDLAMVLIVLTDWDPSAAVQRLLARVGFVLVPASVLLIKYYPNLGRAYHPWSWVVYYVGVAGGKNELGMLCLIFGIASMWRFVRVYRGEEGGRRAGPLVAHGVILAMALWLFSIVNSATSWACFLIATLLIVSTSLRALDRKPLVAHLFVAVMLTVAFSALFLDLSGGLVASLGRDATLTGRTEIWKLVLPMAGNPLVGTGFESFWLGERLEKMWSLYWWHPNEAHNGYLEIYLNLGWIGVALLALVLVTGYRNVVAAYRYDSKTGRLKLAYFVVAVAYNFTESAIRIMDPMWIILLFSIMRVPKASVGEGPLLHGSDYPVELAEPEPQVDPVFRAARHRRPFESFR